MMLLEVAESAAKNAGELLQAFRDVLAEQALPDKCVQYVMARMEPFVFGITLSAGYPTEIERQAFADGVEASKELHSQRLAALLFAYVEVWQVRNGFA